MSEQRRSGTRLPAFSLVELLVVIGIIGLLLALLLPALGRAQRSAKTVQCAAKLRQIGIALFAYAAENHSDLPPTGGWQVYPDGVSSEDEPGLAWTELLASKTGVKPDSALYDCPSFPPEARHNYFLTCRWPMVAGSHSVRLAQVRNSSQFVLSGDCTNPNEYPAPFGTNSKTTVDCDKDDLLSELLLFADQPDGLNVHLGGNNVLFADGHVALFSRFDPAAMTYDGTAMRRWGEVQP